MTECIQFYERELFASARSARPGSELNREVIGVLLNRIVEFYHRSELKFEADHPKIPARIKNGYKWPPLHTAVVEVCREAEVLTDALDDANRDALRIIKNAWNDEQSRAAKPFEQAQLFLECWLPTDRIETVLGSLILEAAGYPANLAYAVWLGEHHEA